MIRGICLLLSFVLMCNCTTDKKTRIAKDTEPLFMNLNSNDPEYKHTVEKAQSEMPRFLARLDSIDETATSSVKIFIPDTHGNGAFIWLIEPRFKLDSAEAKIFELPSEFNNLRVGDKLKFRKDDIHDWIIIDREGKMDGGFSLRYQRSKLSPEGQKEFDKYIGVKDYL